MARSSETTPVVPPIFGFVIAIAILYFARDLLIPFVFALFFAFLLTPLVKRLESWRVPRVPAALLVLCLATSALAVVGWIVADQLIDVLRGQPTYIENIQRKLEGLQGRSRGLNDIVSSLQDLGQELSARRSGIAPRNAAPMQVEVVERHGLIQAVRDYSRPLLKPLGTVGLTVVFTIFMLIDREDMRNRLLRLMGQQKLQATTKAMDDAGQRVSRYVLMQFAVNAGFGGVIAVGLSLIGVPSPLLWGVLGVFLRFLPYLGGVIAGLLPFSLALAASEGWRMPLLVVALFAVTEAITANFVEPLLYGVHTGLSAVAILVSAVFWTVIWGPVGLVLATPLAVCLSAIGRYSPQFEYLNVVLGDEPVLSQDVIFYQRLLALDQHDAFNVLEVLAKDKPLIAVFDEIVLPALAMAERDRHTGQLDLKREEFIVQSVNEFVTELQEADAEPLAGRELKRNRVFCIPARSAADEIAAAMCAHFLSQEGFPAIAFPVGDSPGQLVKNLGIQQDDVVCISAVPPFAASNARRVARNIRENGVNPLTVAALWTYTTANSSRIERVRKSLSAIVVTTLADAVAQIKGADVTAG